VHPMQRMRAQPVGGGQERRNVPLPGPLRRRRGQPHLHRALPLLPHVRPEAGRGPPAGLLEPGGGTACQRAPRPRHGDRLAGPHLHGAPYVCRGARRLRPRTSPPRRGDAPGPLGEPRGRRRTRPPAPRRGQPGGAGGAGDRGLLGRGRCAELGRGTQRETQGASRGDRRRRDRHKEGGRPRHGRLVGRARAGRGAALGPRPGRRPGRGRAV
ncbi:MAG: hypothetical protein AVDCRST_MAG03-948, partial [uncultured Rubrobacteraceae bacterium]